MGKHAGKIQTDQKTIRAFTREANRLGIQVMMYNNATPSGSITFSITPGGDTDNESLEALAPLPPFATQSPAGDRDFRITIDGVGVRNHRTYALTCRMTAESADKMIVDHRVQYPIRFTPQAVTPAKVAAWCPEEWTQPRIDVNGVAQALYKLWR